MVRARTLRCDERQKLDEIDQCPQHEDRESQARYFTVMHYNFCRKHETLAKAAGGIHRTPAMAAGVSDHVWKLEETVALLSDSQK